LASAIFLRTPAACKLVPREHPADAIAGDKAQRSDDHSCRSEMFSGICGDVEFLSDNRNLCFQLGRRLMKAIALFQGTQL
jgi:hypothetical protein